MFYGEHLSADEVALKCKCGQTATVEIFSKLEISQGWFCSSCGHRKHKELRKREAFATAIVRKTR
jgi:hypothetical protein